MTINTQNSYTKIRYTIIGSSFESYYFVAPSEYYLRNWCSSPWNIDKISSTGFIKKRCDYA